MSINTRNDRELFSGLLFVAIGAPAAWIASGYQLSGEGGLGPGVFPLLLGVVLSLIGLAQIGFGLRSHVREIVRFYEWRPLALLCLGVLGFALLIEPAGMVIAVAWATLCSCLAGERFRPVEALLILLVLELISGAIFVVGLNVPPAYLLPHG